MELSFWSFSLCPFTVLLSSLLAVLSEVLPPSARKQDCKSNGGFLLPNENNTENSLGIQLFFFCQYPVIVLNECTRKYALFHQRSLSFVNLTQLFFLSVFNMFRHFGSCPETRQTSRKADLHACVRVKFLLAAQTLRFLSAAVESVNEKNVNKCA